MAAVSLRTGCCRISGSSGRGAAERCGGAGGARQPRQHLLLQLRLTGAPRKHMPGTGGFTILGLGLCAGYGLLARRR